MTHVGSGSWPERGEGMPALRGPHQVREGFRAPAPPALPF